MSIGYHGKGGLEQDGYGDVIPLRWQPKRITTLCNNHVMVRVNLE
ncbi:hypothetical protein N9X34_04160 [Alphaproteobacteria bacterium]|nr:hypothetical protein [Alphaproteobacteria bacterium]